MKKIEFRTPEAWNGQSPSADEKKKSTRRILSVIGLTVVLLLVYFSVNTLVDKGLLDRAWGITVMIIYMASFAGLLVGYIVYNRAFIHKNVTPEMLPDDWSDERKQSFIAENKMREEKSRWLLYLLIPFIFVFLAEAMYLFLWVDNLEHYFTV